jgi:hypothetical protein
MGTNTHTTFRQQLISNMDLPPSWKVPDSYIYLEPFDHVAKRNAMEHWQKMLRTTTAAQRDAEGIYMPPHYYVRSLSNRLVEKSESVIGYPDDALTLSILRHGVNEILLDLMNLACIPYWVDDAGVPGAIDGIDPYVSGGVLRFSALLYRADWLA